MSARLPAIGRRRLLCSSHVIGCKHLRGPRLRFLARLVDLQPFEMTGQARIIASIAVWTATGTGPMRTQHDPAKNAYSENQGQYF